MFEDGEVWYVEKGERFSYNRREIYTDTVTIFDGNNKYELPIDQFKACYRRIL